MDTTAFTPDQLQRISKVEEALGYTFSDKKVILAAITHPSAAEGQSIEASYERLEFLGDSIVGAIIAREAFSRFPDLDEGGLTRIKVALVAGSTLSEVASGLGFDDIIIFGESERGTGKRGMHSALENVYEAVTAALFLDGGLSAAYTFVSNTLFPRMTKDYAVRPENPKSALQEKLQEEGITPTYKLIETQGPPHDRTFITAVFAGVQSLARGVGRTKKESESRAADTALQLIRKEEKARAKEAKKAVKEQRKRERAAEAAGSCPETAAASSHIPGSCSAAAEASAETVCAAVDGECASSGSPTPAIETSSAPLAPHGFDGPADAR